MIIRPETKHSDELQEVVYAMPSWIIRWGVTVMFIVTVSFIIFSWLIKYPDIIESQIVLTTSIPPVSLIASTEGHIHLLVEDGQNIEESEYLAVIENSANYKDVLKLKEALRGVNTGSIGHFEINNLGQIGELSSPLISLMSLKQEYLQADSSKYYDELINGLRKQIAHNWELNEQFQKQSKIMMRELNLAEKKLAADSFLYDQGAIAELDFEDRQRDYMQLQRSAISSNAAVSNSRITIIELKNRITDYKKQKHDYYQRIKNEINENIKQLQVRIDDWENKYVLYSPVDGKVAFTRYWSNSQFISMGDRVMTILPYSEELYGRITLPISGSGKVEPGQEVRIFFDNYPSNEYGIVKGSVQRISAIPEQDTYIADIALPEGITTTYGNDLIFRQEMRGKAEIITSDLRLFDRLFDQVRKLSENLDEV